MVAVNTLPKNEPKVETKRIFPAANHLFPLVSCVMIGMVCDAAATGRKKKSKEKTKSAGIYANVCTNVSKRWA